MKTLVQSTRRFLRPVRRVVRDFIFRPRGTRMGEGSYIKRPYRLLFPEFLSVGKNTRIHSNAYITPLGAYAGLRYKPEIRIGSDVYIGRFAHFVAIDLIEIGDGCVLSEFVYITDNAHGLHPERGPIMRQPLESKGPVRIGNGCFLGFRVSVMPGVTLGDHCVVGANSVVTRSFPAYSMIAGCPAKVVKVFSHRAGDWVRVHPKMRPGPALCDGCERTASASGLLTTE
jgi:acetyltransferase-like isoleucine patch superfamily enzyme